MAATTSDALERLRALDRDMGTRIASHEETERGTRHDTVRSEYLGRREEASFWRQKLRLILMALE